MAKTRAEMHDVAVQALKAAGTPVPDRPSSRQHRGGAGHRLCRRPARDKLVETAKARWPRRPISCAKDLITLPDAPVKVILMPKFQQGVAVAYCDPPGPLDKGLQTFYAVSPIPDDWTAAQRTASCANIITAASRTSRCMRRCPAIMSSVACQPQSSVLRAVLWSGSFVEGWAVYAEDMMAEKGFLDGDPLYG